MSTSVIPTFRYADARAGLEFLIGAFGFEEHMIVDHEGVVMHAQLRHGSGMIMLSQVRTDAFDELQAPPVAGRPVNSSAYIVVADVDAHHDRAVAAGAQIVGPLKSEAHGRMYSAQDPEGNLWNFGDYDPYAPPG